MLGITPGLLSRPLRCRQNARVLRTVVAPYHHDFLRHEAFRAVGRAGFKSKVAGDNESGHIEAGENEKMFFIDSKYYKDFWPLARVRKTLESKIVGLLPPLLLERWGSFLYDSG